MSQINVNSEDKQTFDELKPEDSTQAEFFAEIMTIYQSVREPTIVDPEEIAEEIKRSVASEIELAAYRGIDDRLNQ